MPEGTVQVNGNTVPVDHFALMADSGNTFTLEATTDAVVLVMSGEPIDEPIVAHGPFVMNSVQEIHEAMHDGSTGKFEVLEDAY